MFFLIKCVMEYANAHLTAVPKSQVSFSNVKDRQMLVNQ